MKKEKSSESIIASFLQRNESLVAEDAEQDDKKQEDEPSVPELPAEEEGVPEVIEVDAEKSGAQDVEAQSEPVREVAEAGTNMTISANEAALELQRINEKVLADTREELVQKEEKIKKMAEQVTMLEHALADKEQDMEEQAAEHHEKRSDEERS